MTGLCPTLLAHGRLATVDVGLALFAITLLMNVASNVVLRRYREVYE